jgi:hypothetical protein
MQFGRPLGLWESKADPTRQELIQAQRLQDFATTRFEVSFERQVAAILRKYTAAAANAAEQFGANFSVETATGGMEAELLAAISAQYTRVATFFGNEFFESLEKSFQIPQTKDQGGIFAEQLRQFVQENAAKRVGQVTETTRGLIRGAISSAIEENLGPFGMAKLIELQSGGVVAGRRARTIARTETHTAAQYGQDAAADATGVAFRKFWAAVDDQRTREDHEEAEVDSKSRVILNGQPFNVGGESLMFPGDPRGSAEQIINCRCAVLRRPIL